MVKVLQGKSVLLIDYYGIILNFFKDEIKEKDQTIRKSEQELESLVFRNEQLSKRVLVLQDELAKIGSHSHKKRLVYTHQD